MTAWPPMAHTTGDDASGGPPAAEPPEVRAPRRADASMTLLREVMERPLDPGYALAAETRQQRGRPSRAALAITLAVAILCGWLFVRSVAELRRPQPDVLRARVLLEDEIRRRTERLDAQRTANERLRQQIADAQNRALAPSGGSSVVEQARTLALVTGESAATGPGLEVTLDDAPRSSDPAAGTDPRADGGTDEGRVLDRDLQLVVNGLWASGAEAVAINGQRLTALSAIRSAGQAVLVDYRPLRPPYVLDAVGNAADLQTRFAASMAGAYLQSLRDNYGVRVGIGARDKLVLPAASSLTLRTATAPTAATTSPSAPAASSPTAPPGTGGASQEVSP